MTSRPDLMIHPALRRAAKPCGCPAYRFPHRRSGGQCQIGKTPVCSSCGCSTNPVFNAGHSEPSEFWGAVALIIYPDFETSRCCEAPVLGINDNWKETP